MILTTDIVSEGATRFDRTGYVVAYEIDSFSLEGNDLRFQFVKRLYELA